MRWRVRHRLLPLVPVTAPVERFETLGLRLGYVNAKLVGVEHVLYTEVADGEVGDTSDGQLHFLWEYLQFCCGQPVTRAQQTIEPVEHPADHPWIRGGRTTLRSGYAVIRPVEWPSEAVLERLAESPNIVLWLHFANRAEATKSDAEAVRLYFLIWEDWGHLGSAPDDVRGWNLGLTRHFLSHARIDDPQLLDFLAEHLRPGTSRYDPRSPEHVAFVRGVRGEARDLMTTELMRRIGKLTRVEEPE